MKKKLKLSQIRTDGKTQSRKSIDPKWVKNYAENMKEGAIFPLPVVFFDGTDHWLADGFHRVAAMKSNGLLEIEVEIREGSVRDAKLFAIGANNLHGRNMSFDEIRNNIIEMLKDEEWGQWSDDRIAKSVNVSRITVYRIRKSLEKKGEVQPKTSTKYVDKQGKENTMAISRKPATEEKKEEPEQEEEELSPEEIERMQMPDTIAQLTEENEKLKEQVALGLFEGNEFEKIDIQEMLADLKEKNRMLELENKTLRESRDAYQYENAELIKTVKSLKAKLKKLGAE